MGYVLPPREVFEIDPESIAQDTNERVGKKGFGLGGWIETVCPPEGGMYARYEGLLHPYKGHPWAEAVEANNKLKRATLALVKPFAHKVMVLPAIAFALTPQKWKISFLEGWLWEYWRQFEEIMVNGQHCYVLLEERYNNFSRALWKLIYHFLMGIGITEQTAYNTGKIIATMFEWDDAYRLPAEDAFSETTLEEMLSNPRKEILRIVNILAQRSNVHMGARFNSFAQIIAAAMLIPKVNKSFKAALKKIKFEFLQLDEIDYYHVLGRNDYQYLGRSIEDRIEERKKIEVVSQIQVAS